MILESKRMVDVYTNPEKHVILHNNVRMPILGLGTSHNGGYSHDAVVYALRECGYRLIDTAKRYGCEKYIGQAVKESNVDRSELFLATKCWPTDYGKEKTKAAARESCKRLNVDYLDIYFLHWPDVPSGYNKKELLAESWRALELLYDEELVRTIGVSNFLERHLESLLEECSIIPHVNQCEFHPFNNPRSLREMCAENKIQFQGYSPLAKGQLLTANFVTELSRELGRAPSQVLVRWSIQNRVPTIPKSTKPKRVLENSQGYSPLAGGAVLTDQVIASIARALNRSCSQVVLRWNVQNRVVCIPKSTEEKRVKLNGEIFDFELSPTDMQMLNSLPQCLNVIDRSLIQEKIDNPQPDGYKLKFIKVPSTIT